jgi:hypothetical protein
MLHHVPSECLEHLGNPNLIPALSLDSKRRFRHLRPHQSTDYKVLRRKQPLCYSRRFPVRGISSVTMSTRTPPSNRQNCCHRECRLNETLKFTIRCRCFHVCWPRHPVHRTSSVHESKPRNTPPKPFCIASATGACCMITLLQQRGLSTQCHGDLQLGQYGFAGTVILKKALRDPSP